MKKITLFIALVFIVQFSKAQIVDIPDAVFKARLVNNSAINTNGDDEIQTTEAADYTGIINLYMANDIFDLTGIEAFTSITSLYCSGTSLSALDVSSCVALTTLQCVNTPLTSIDASDCVALETLHCSQSQVSTLDISSCSSLIELDCHSNQITSLDFSSSIALETLQTSDNLLTSLDVSSCVALTTLKCGNNEISSLDVSANSALTRLHCYNNNLTSLDVLANEVLTTLWCSSNDLTSLDISTNTALTYLDCSFNNLTNLDVLSNTTLTNLACSGNSLNNLNVSANTLLTELQCINIDIDTLDLSSNTELKYLTCKTNQITDLDLSSNLLLTSLDCDRNQITNLDLSLLSVLTRLSCSENSLSSLDLRNGNNDLITLFDALENPSLLCTFVDDVAYSTSNWINIDANATFIETDAECSVLDTIPPVPNMNTLIDLSSECQINAPPFPTATDNISGIITGTTNVSFPITTQGTTIVTWTYNDNNGNTSTQTQNVVIDDTTLPTAVAQDITIDLVGEDSISILASQIDNGSSDNCNIASISIDTDTFTATGEYEITLSVTDDNNNTSTDTANVTVVDSLELTYVPDDNFEQALIDLGYDDVLDDYVSTMNINTVLFLFLNYKDIADLTGVEDFSSLLYLHCEYNQLTEINVSQNTALTQLKCGNNDITSLDVSQNTELQLLYCGVNEINSLDVSQNLSLTDLDCGSNNLSTLDTSQNTVLTSLHCILNQITSLDLSLSLTYLHCSNNELTNLDISQLSLLTDLDCSFNELSVLELSQNTALTELICNSNQLTTLDVSQNTALTDLFCQYNELSNLDARNENNASLNYFNASANPSLNCIYVDNTTYSTDNWTNIDDQSTFVETEAECSALDTTAPVPNEATLPDLINDCVIYAPTAPTATDDFSGIITGTTTSVFPIGEEGTTVITWTYDDGNGNISTQNQNAIITPIDTTTTLLEHTITANAVGAYTYQWLDCNNGNMPIDGATNQSYTPTENGSYAVEINAGICAVISDCIVIAGIGLEDSDFTSLSVYPNPTNGTVNIDFGGAYEEINVSVYNLLGQSVITNTYYSVNSINLNLKVPVGAYFVKIKTPKGKNTTIKVLVK